MKVWAGFCPEEGVTKKFDRAVMKGRAGLCPEGGYSPQPRVLTGVLTLGTDHQKVTRPERAADFVVAITGM
jgi:hypothetical protein